MSRGRLQDIHFGKHAYGRNLSQAAVQLRSALIIGDAFYSKHQMAMESSWYMHNLHMFVTPSHHLTSK